MKSSLFLSSFITCATILISSSAPLRSEILLKPEQKVAFLGDSITQQGASNATGYVRLVETGLKANGVPITIIGAGLSGNKSNQMLARLKTDVIDKKPDWMILSCGVNDVWHGQRGVPLEDYKKNITAILDHCTEAGVKVMVLTATPIFEKENELNATLAAYNDFLRELAAERKLPLADLNAAMWAEIKAPTQPRPAGNFYLTHDGVHMGPFGDAVMAEGILKAFGLDASQQAKAREAWDGMLTTLRGQGKLTIAEYRKLVALAAKRNMPLEAFTAEIFSEALKRSISADSPTP